MTHPALLRVIFGAILVAGAIGAKPPVPGDEGSDCSPYENIVCATASNVYWDKACDGDPGGGESLSSAGCVSCCVSVNDVCYTEYGDVEDASPCPNSER